MRDFHAAKCIFCGEKRGTTKQHMTHMVHGTYDTHDRYAESILFVEKNEGQLSNTIWY